MRSQVKRAARSRPRSTSRAASARSSSSRPIAPAISAYRQRVEQQRRVARDLRERGGVRARDRHPARHRLEHRQPEALVERGEHERVGERPQALEQLAADPAGEAHAVLEAEAPGLLAQLLLVRGRVTGEHEHRAQLAGQRGERLDQPRQVLVRALGGERQQHRPVGQAEPFADRAGVERGDASAQPEALGHDVDLLGGHAEHPQQVVAGALRDRDHAVAAAHGGGHEHPHADVPQARVGLGEARVDQVVDGDDAAERPPHRRGRGERVEQRDAVPRGERRQQRLLAEHPLDAVARADGDADRLHLAPGPVGGGGLAAEEGGEPHAGRRLGEQLGDQLARRDLHAAGLAGDEEDQVEGDVHRGVVRWFGFPGAEGRASVLPRREVGPRSV